jgi:hypothetical protein
MHGLNDDATRHCRRGGIAAAPRRVHILKPAGDRTPLVRVEDSCRALQSVLLKKGLEDKLAGDQPKLDTLRAITPHQARILNPLSHDPTTSLNEAEVVAAIEAVEALMAALRI